MIRMLHATVDLLVHLALWRGWVDNVSWIDGLQVLARFVLYSSGLMGKVLSVFMLPMFRADEESP